MFPEWQIQDSFQFVVSAETRRLLLEEYESSLGDVLRRQMQEASGLQAVGTGHLTRWVTFLGPGDGR